MGNVRLKLSIHFHGLRYNCALTLLGQLCCGLSPSSGELNGLFWTMMPSGIIIHNAIAFSSEDKIRIKSIDQRSREIGLVMPMTKPSPTNEIFHMISISS